MTRMQHGRGGENHGPTIEVINAPYNFVPLAEWVHKPGDTHLISHDVPLRDGLCGELVFDLVAESPLLVGGSQQEASAQAPGVIKPFRTPDGYAIPGSSLRGMIRSVLEIATFSRMRQVDDVSPALRDISGRFVEDAYHDRVDKKVKAGFMRLGDDGVRTLIPCKLAAVKHSEMQRWLGEDRPLFSTEHRAVSAKYEAWSKIATRHGVHAQQVRFNLSDNEAVQLGRGDHEGQLVLTGQVSVPRNGKPGKARDYLFFDEEPEQAVDVSDTDWRDFLATHHDDETDKTKDMAWPGYWRARFRSGEPVPVFYLEDQQSGVDGNARGKLRIGLAFMPRLAGDFSVREMIGHSTPEHNEQPGQTDRYDFCDLLFGTVSKIQNDSLGGRVSFRLATSQEDAKTIEQAPTILNGPKPSYFPNYIQQKADPNTHKVSLEKGYATYLRSPKHRDPKIRGFKRYPARPGKETGVQRLTSEQEKNRKLQVELHTLPPGVKFKGRCVFHNLRPEELGALVWGLTWGGNEDLRHGLGMGKPFGFGQLRIKINTDETRIRPNDRQRAPDAIMDYSKAFSEYMEQVCADQPKQSRRWHDSKQVSALLAMADPATAKDFPGKLQHMHLSTKPRRNDFSDAKTAGLVLAGWPTGEESSAPSAGPKISGDSPAGQWLAAKIEEITTTNHSQPGEALKGKGLAGAWNAIEDEKLKVAVLELIKAEWVARGWWDEPQGKAMKAARKVYAGD